MPGTNYRGYDMGNRTFLLNGSPTNTFVENFPRDQITGDLVAALVTAVMTSTAVELYAGDIVNSLTFLSGATAVGTPTNEWAALYDPNGNRLAQSTTVSTAWAADTAKTFTLATPQTISSTGIYYAALMVAATTPPTLMGRTMGRPSAAGAIVAGQVLLAQSSGSALTTTAPATIATPTAQAVIPYVVLQ